MKLKCVLLLLITCLSVQASPIQELLERIDKGASKKFLIEKVKSDQDFFELDQKGKKVVVRGNNYVNIATGINWYLKYYAGIHLSWNGMQAKLPAELPPVTQKERRETSMKYRYDLNYCTYSYTMAFWDWERWEKEIDWMALHGINIPLSVVGVETVWYNVLEKLGYTKSEINDFIAGPGFLAWWLMNNLEGWGGPNPDNWYKQQTALQQRIVKRMREYGIEPVFPGYAGIVPHNAKEKIGLNVSDPGNWGAYKRPAFLQPTDPRFGEIAQLYYKELEKLYGKANYFSMDPFHEGGSVEGVDLDAAGKAIMREMKTANPKAVWVMQAWQACPHQAMIENLPQGDLLVLDLFSESRPQWGDPQSTWYRKDGYGKHDWLYCMLLNFGGNVGLHGKMNHVIQSFYDAKSGSKGEMLKGVGITMEGSENNPVMFELLCELPWRNERFEKDEWLRNYTFARYGTNDSQIMEAWKLLSNSIYNCPDRSVQEGTTESVFCARPAEVITTVSSWSNCEVYYNPEDVIQAARLFLSVADKYKGNNNFEYDLIDILRQAITEKGRVVQRAVTAAYHAGNIKAFKMLSTQYLHLIDCQDELLGTRPEFKVGSWINKARKLGQTQDEKDLYEWNARVQITTWGNRQAAEGGLRDYAHREWNGLLKDFYRYRWSTYFNYLEAKMRGENPKEIDFYSIEEPWTLQHNTYSDSPQGDVVITAKRIWKEVGL
ncbi:alpha-N-acetylglucosaminidase [Parabacteroides sp. AM08-6]|uniref:alpha-N-acetylglucosaminidase n=1 Tax=Parabacteroides sp. AM08-6 TaxID=2292053 RepID=UPI000EFEF124|nr:alpha-N-acetylglucosaminidase [Parabacteroides sp. AM08-6]RHJ82758.1 alpha-N-acetylglucosaminidase [Parabacteroides sp. AM08-6]